MKKERLSTAEALSFLLTYIVVDRGITLELNQLNLFTLSNLAQRASEDISNTDGIIPHELIEELAEEFLEAP